MSSTCRGLVEGFVRRLASRVAEDVERGGPGLGIGRVLEEAYLYAAARGGCREETEGLDTVELLRREAAEAARIALDAVMEAMSRHMEALDDETHAQLSVTLTAYAAHVARLAVALLEESKKDPDMLQLLEPLLFASIYRLLAVAHYVKTLPTEALPELAARLRRVVEDYIAEENMFLANIAYTLTGGAGVAESEEAGGGGSEAHGPPGLLRDTAQGAG